MTVKMVIEGQRVQKARLGQLVRRAPRAHKVPRGCRAREARLACLDPQAPRAHKVRRAPKALQVLKGRLA